MALSMGRYTIENVTGDHTIEALFEPDETPPKFHTIAATAGPGGSIDPRGLVQVADGEDQTFIMVADPGFHITKVLVDGAEVPFAQTKP